MGYGVAVGVVLRGKDRQPTLSDFALLELISVFLSTNLKHAPLSRADTAPLWMADFSRTALNLSAASTIVCGAVFRITAQALVRPAF